MPDTDEEETLHYTLALKGFTAQNSVPPNRAEDTGQARHNTAATWTRHTRHHRIQRVSRNSGGNTVNLEGEEKTGIPIPARSAKYEKESRLRNMA